MKKYLSALFGLLLGAVGVQFIGTHPVVAQTWPAYVAWGKYSSTVNKPLAVDSTGKIIVSSSSSIGGGSPGSPTTSLQYNNAGSLGGISSILWDGSTLAMTETKTGGPFPGTVFAFQDNVLTFNPTATNQNGYGTHNQMLFGGTQDIYQAAGFYSEVNYTAAHDVNSELDGFLTSVTFNTSNSAPKVIGVSARVFSAGSVTDLWGMASFNNTNNGTVTAFTEGFHAGPWRGSGTSPAEAAFYAEDYADSTATNIYYLWLDSRGVYRIREDNTFDSVGQAIATLYNPLFTKYSAGTPNFERCIPGCQWETNVAFIGNEAGGTGTLRDVKFMGQDIIPSPTGFFYLHSAAATAAPASGDCDAAAETNRVVYDSTNDNLYVCSGASGWRKIVTAAP